MASLLRASLLGGVDGVITSFAVVASVEAGDFDTRVAVVVGVSNVCADGLSMGISEYLSSTSAQKLDDAPRASPALLGIACFATFVVCGLVPLALYALSDASLLVGALASISELMLLGLTRSRVAGEPLLIAVWQTVALGVLVGSLAYAVASLVPE